LSYGEGGVGTQCKTDRDARETPRHSLKEPASGKGLSWTREGVMARRMRGSKSGSVALYKLTNNTYEVVNTGTERVRAFDTYEAALLDYIAEMLGTLT